MSTQHMPNPPSQPTNQAPQPGAETQPAQGESGTTAPATPQQAAPAAPATSAVPVTSADQPEQAAEAQTQTPSLPFGEDMARVLESQAEVIVQRQVYHSQMMTGVSALGSDPVSARNAVLTVANALRHKNSENLEYALANLGDPQLAQVNDHTLPWKFNAQVAGLMEGLLIDTLMQAYRDDPTKQRQARSTLETLFLEANEQTERQHKAQLAFLAPLGGPNARN